MSFTLNQFIFRLFRNFKKSFSDDQIISEKILIREEVKAAKKNLTDELKEQQAEAVYIKLERMKEFINAKTVLMYWSMNDELPTHKFIKKWSQSKTILLPVVKGDHMAIRPFKTEANLVSGSLKIMEPMNSHDYMKLVDLVIVPGVAFDRKKRRLGRGKGYYDRYFKNKRITKWGIGFDFQLYETIPSASFDIQMNRIITPSETVL